MHTRYKNEGSRIWDRAKQYFAPKVALLYDLPKMGLRSNHRSQYLCLKTVFFFFNVIFWVSFCLIYKIFDSYQIVFLKRPPTAKSDKTDRCCVHLTVLQQSFCNLFSKKKFYIIIVDRVNIWEYSCIFLSSSKQHFKNYVNSEWPKID